MKDFKHIRHIYFDLDNTLWDFSSNSKKILLRMYAEFGLKEKGISDFDLFIQQYHFRNEYLWREYGLGHIQREEVRLNRFHITFNDFGIDSYKLASDAADFYVTHTRMQTDLLPGAIDILEYLKHNYSLHIITNGFEEVQFFKLNNSGIASYFKTVTTAEAAKALKPDKKIFDFAMQKTNSTAPESVYIGDAAEIDGTGAKNAGMHFIWLNTSGKRTDTIRSAQIKALIELKELF